MGIKEVVHSIKLLKRIVNSKKPETAIKANKIKVNSMICLNKRYYES